MVTWNNSYNEKSRVFYDKYEAERFFKEMIMDYGYNQPCLFKLVKRYTTWHSDQRRYDD